MMDTRTFLAAADLALAAAAGERADHALADAADDTDAADAGMARAPLPDHPQRGLARRGRVPRLDRGHRPTAHRRRQRGGVVNPQDMTTTRPSSTQNEGRPVIRTTADLQPGEQVLILAREVRTVDTVTSRERPGAAGERWLAVTWAEDEPEWIATPDREWHLVTPELRERWANEDAELLPQRTDGDRPAVRVGGALVFAYWDAGALRVSIDTRDVADPLFVDAADGEHACAVLVDLDAGTVHERGRS